MWQFRRALIPQDGAQQYPLSPQEKKKKKKKDEFGRYAFIPSPGCGTRDPALGMEWRSRMPNDTQSIPRLLLTCGRLVTVYSHRY